MIQNEHKALKRLLSNDVHYPYPKSCSQFVIVMYVVLVFDHGVIEHRLIE